MVTRRRRARSLAKGCLLTYALVGSLFAAKRRRSASTHRGGRRSTRISARGGHSHRAIRNPRSPENAATGSKLAPSTYPADACTTPSPSVESRSAMDVQGGRRRADDAVISSVPSIGPRGGCFEGDNMPSAQIDLSRVSMPRYIAVEWTSRCNLRCLYCQKSGKEWNAIPGRDQDLDEELLDRMLTGLKAYPAKQLEISGIQVRRPSARTGLKYSIGFVRLECQSAS